MYTFDETKEEAMETYEEVTDCYKRILHALNLPFVKGLLVLLYTVNVHIRVVCCISLNFSILIETLQVCIM